jgi:hypothetical protein
MATTASERQDYESYKFGGTAPDSIYVKTLDQHDASNPLPVSSVQHTSSDLEGKGPITVGTTAVEISFTGLTESIIISSKITNTGIIYVGKSNVTNLGANSIAFLDVGESITIDYNDSTNSIYVVADTANQVVFAGAAL